MAKKKPFTIETHQLIGTELHAMNHRLQSIEVMVAKAYGKTSKPRKRIERMTTILEMLRNELEELAACELGDAFDVHLYYPGTKLAKFHESV